MSKIGKIASNITTNIGKKLDKLSTKIGTPISNALEKTPDKDSFASKLIKAYEPTGANNSFLGMATLMVSTVIIPRVLTAAKRNPDDKEATKDEITEILFRDVQTVLIILFALKSANSLVTSVASKMNGLPMTSKPYEKLFNTTAKGFEGIKEKGKEFIQNPLKKGKIALKNVLNTLHPTGGVRALTNEEFTEKYSGFSSLKDIKKMFNQIGEENGNPQQVFNKVMDIQIKQQEELLNGSKKTKGLLARAAETANKDGSYTPEMQKSIENTKEIMQSLKDLKAKGLEGLDEEKIDEATKNILTSFFKDKNNRLVMDAKGLNAILRTGALAFESLYLGFGLPALNQRRLEKKYLEKESNFMPKNQAGNNALVNKTIKAQEIKIYHNFIK